jgi:CTP:molybdopterin cytidylyltransferase MocA
MSHHPVPPTPASPGVVGPTRDESPAGRFATLVMAGSRSGGDPLARATNVSHKALASLEGVPMLGRVLQTLAVSRSVGRIVVCGLEESVFRRASDRLAAGERQSLVWIRGGETPARSAAMAIGELGLRPPVLITTADHPLLRPETVDDFCARSLLSGGDATFAVVPGAAVSAAFPGIARTRYRFRDGSYCGCNLYALLTTAGCGAPAVWMRVEQYRKRPWRVLRGLGFFVLARFLLGRLALTEIPPLTRSRVGLRIEPVVLMDAAAGFDVDDVRQLAAAELFLRRRGA